MVFGSDVGVVLRARKGRNILVQSHGLDVKAVTQAATEVAAVLEGDLPSSIELLDVGVGVQHALACGHLRVLGNRLNLTAAISRLLVAEVKSVELTGDKLLKKYAQVYLSVDALVNKGSLDLVGALLEANSVLESLSPEALKVRRAKQQADLQSAAAADKTRQIARYDLSLMVVVNLPTYQLPELPAPDRPLPKPVQQASLPVPLVVDDTRAAGEEEKKEGDEAWTSFDQEQQQQQQPQSSLPLSFSGPPLLLQECWQVEVCGSKILRAGLTGAVRWAAPEAKALSGSVLFKVQPPDEPSAMVINSLCSSLASSKGTKHGAVLGSFLADTLSPLPAAAALLQYSLPATFEVIPLLVRITGGFVEHKNGAAVALVTVQWHVPREVKQQPADLCIDLRVPPGFDSPRKVEPAGAVWSSSQSLLRWQVPAVSIGASGCVVAAFRVKDGAEAAAAGIGRCYAVLRLQGQGTTVSGVQLAQARSAGAQLSVEAATSSWAAYVMARPNVAAV
eukprot:gene10746-10902_t